MLDVSCARALRCAERGSHAQNCSLWNGLPGEMQHVEVQRQQVDTNKRNKFALCTAEQSLHSRSEEIFHLFRRIHAVDALLETWDEPGQQARLTTYIAPGQVLRNARCQRLIDRAKQKRKTLQPIRVGLALRQCGEIMPIGCRTIVQKEFFALEMVGAWLKRRIAAY